MDETDEVIIELLKVYKPEVFDPFIRGLISRAIKISSQLEPQVKPANGGQYKPDIKTIWAMKEIKIGDSKIKIVADTQVPKDEFWCVDENNDIQKFRMIDLP
jgi:hypothetical protein